MDGDGDEGKLGIWLEIWSKSLSRPCTVSLTSHVLPYGLLLLFGSSLFGGWGPPMWHAGDWHLAIGQAEDVAAETLFLFLDLEFNSQEESWNFAKYKWDWWLNQFRRDGKRRDKHIIFLFELLESSEPLDVKIMIKSIWCSVQYKHSDNSQPQRQKNTSKVI